MYNDISNFSTLKFFGINTRPRKASRPTQVLWSFSLVGWIKVNTNDVAIGSSDLLLVLNSLKGV